MKGDQPGLLALRALAKKERPSPWRFPIRTSHLGGEAGEGQANRNGGVDGVGDGRVAEGKDETVFHGEVDRMVRAGCWGK